MELSYKERERIYLEEKARREESQESSSSTLLILNILAAVGIWGLFKLNEIYKGRKISLDALRKAYDGLAPEDEK